MGSELANSEKFGSSQELIFIDFPMNSWLRNYWVRYLASFLVISKHVFVCLLNITICHSPIHQRHLPPSPALFDIFFQEHMYENFSDLDYICVYINDLLVTSCSSFEEHLQWLKLAFSWLSEVGLNVNANKSHFALSENEYLVYWITKNGIHPVPKKLKQCNALLL
jgi:hypothetical protein